MTFLRFLMLLALVIWVGGIIFFAFVVAPSVFTILTRQMAGNVVQRSLGALHWIGVGCGIVFLVCSLLSLPRRTPAQRFGKVRHAAVLAMIILTLLSQIVVTGRMRTLRAGITDIDALSLTDPARVQFDALHRWSTTLETIVLLLGLIALYDVARPQSFGRVTVGSAGTLPTPDIRPPVYPAT